MSSLDSYWNQYAEDFATNYNEEMAKFIRDLALSLRVSNVLEVGCSAGNDLRLFPLGFDVNGIDQSEFAVNIAQKNLPTFKFNTAAAATLPFDDSSVDFVFTRNMLNYIESNDIEKIIKELYRVSKKYILSIERFANDEIVLDGEKIPAWGRNIKKRWMDFRVKIISNVEMHEEIDPKKSRFVLVRKI